MLLTTILALTMGIFGGVILANIWFSKTASKRFSYLEVRQKPRQSHRK